MEMGEALVSRALANPGITAIAGTQVYWVKRPQNMPLPAVVLQTISGDRPQNLEGFDDMATARIQASCFAASYETSRALAEAVIVALVPSATITDASGPDVFFWRADAGEPRDLGEDTANGFVHHASVDLIIRYAKAA